MFERALNAARRLWKAAPIASGILVIALVASLFFGARAFLHWYDRPPLLDRQQPVAAWMTPRYVARAWGIPPEIIRDAIGRPDKGQKGMESLTRIAKERGVPVENLLADLQTAIITFRETRDAERAEQIGKGADND